MARVGVRCVLPDRVEKAALATAHGLEDRRILDQRRKKKKSRPALGGALHRRSATKVSKYAAITPFVTSLRRLDAERRLEARELVLHEAAQQGGLRREMMEQAALGDTGLAATAIQRHGAAPTSCAILLGCVCVCERVRCFPFSSSRNSPLTDAPSRFQFLTVRTVHRADSAPRQAVFPQEIQSLEPWEQKRLPDRLSFLFVSLLFGLPVVGSNSC